MSNNSFLTNLNQQTIKKRFSRLILEKLKYLTWTCLGVFVLSIECPSLIRVGQYYVSHKEVSILYSMHPMSGLHCFTEKLL